MKHVVCWSSDDIHTQHLKQEPCQEFPATSRTYRSEIGSSQAVQHLNSDWNERNISIWVSVCSQKNSISFSTFIDFVGFFYSKLKRKLIQTKKVTVKISQNTKLKFSKIPSCFLEADRRAEAPTKTINDSQAANEICRFSHRSGPILFKMSLAPKTTKTHLFRSKTPIENSLSSAPHNSIATQHG